MWKTFKKIPSIKSRVAEPPEVYRHYSLPPKFDEAEQGKPAVDAAK